MSAQDRLVDWAKSQGWDTEMVAHVFGPFETEKIDLDPWEPTIPNGAGDDPENEGAEASEPENGERDSRDTAQPVNNLSADSAEDDETGNANSSDNSYTVSFSKTHITIKATADIEKTLGGDVRDGNLKLEAGKSSRRKLTGEGNGWVSIGDSRHEVPNG
jgi:hypothetical protein